MELTTQLYWQCIESPGLWNVFGGGYRFFLVLLSTTYLKKTPIAQKINWLMLRIGWKSVLTNGSTYTCLKITAVRISDWGATEPKPSVSTKLYTKKWQSPSKMINRKVRELLVFCYNLSISTRGWSSWRGGGNGDPPFMYLVVDPNKTLNSGLFDV